MKVRLVMDQVLEIAVPRPKQTETRCSITVKKMGSEDWTSVWGKCESFTWAANGFVLQSLFSSSGFLSFPWNHFALWRLACHDHGSSMGSHQLLQGRCGWSHPWNRAWRLVMYRTPSPIPTWRIEFNVLKGSVRIVGKNIRQVISPKREWRDYLTIRSKFPV